MSLAQEMSLAQDMDTDKATVSAMDSYVFVSFEQDEKLAGQYNLARFLGNEGKQYHLYD